MAPHALRYNGAPYTPDGQLAHEDSSVTGGTGRALCACGAMSPDLPSGSQRRAWFKDHKANPDTWTVVSTEAVYADTAEEPVQEEVPEEVAPEPAAEDQKEDVKDAERALPFTDAVASHFWAYLGREATTAFLTQAFPDVTPKYDNKSRVVILQGPEAELETAADAVLTMWSLAIAEFKEWSKGDATWLERPRGGLEGRQASYRLRGEFYVRYAGKYGEEYSSGLI